MLEKEAQDLFDCRAERLLAEYGYLGATVVAVFVVRDPVTLEWVRHHLPQIPDAQLSVLDAAHFFEVIRQPRGFLKAERNDCHRHGTRHCYKYDNRSRRR